MCRRPASSSAQPSQGSRAREGGHREGQGREGEEGRREEQEQGALRLPSDGGRLHRRGPEEGRQE